MTDTCLIGEAGAQGHVAAALAEDRGPAIGHVAQATKKRRIAREPSGMKLRIPAGQVYRIDIVLWRLVRERRERKDLRPGRTPGVEQRRIGEGKGSVFRYGDVLA